MLAKTAGFTLTLPGIAGLIVAVGITADSFIVYFERIRDEVRDGRPLVAAVETGCTDLGPLVRFERCRRAQGARQRRCAGDPRCGVVGGELDQQVHGLVERPRPEQCGQARPVEPGDAEEQVVPTGEVRALVLQHRPQLAAARCAGREGEATP